MKKISIILLLLVATFACKKTVEGETEDWKANKVRLKKLKASYPSFGNLLDKELQEAETKWKEAKEISKEADKIKKMAEANYTFNQGFVYELGTLETKRDNLDRSSKELSQNITSKDTKLSKNALKIVIDINDQAKETLLQVEKLLNKGAKSENSAYTSIKDANNNIFNAEQKINDAKRIISDSKTDKASKKDSSKKSTDVKDSKDTTTIKKKKKKVETEK